MRVDGQDAVDVSNSSVGGPARFTLIASQGTFPDRHHGSMHGVFENIPAQAGLQLEMLISGFTASDEGALQLLVPEMLATHMQSFERYYYRTKVTALELFASKVDHSYDFHLLS